MTALFALGLGISGMTRPEKVIGFLDFFGKWDYSLAFVMVGAVFTHAIAFRPLTDTAENLKKCSNPK